MARKGKKQRRGDNSKAGKGSRNALELQSSKTNKPTYLI